MSFEERFKKIFGKDFAEWYCQCLGVPAEPKKMDRIERKRPTAYIQLQNLIYPVLDLYDSIQESVCGEERPARKVLCQLKKDHKGSHRAVVFWENAPE